MQINLSSGNYNIINSGQVFLFSEKDPLKIDVISDEDFRFSILLKFLKDDSGKIDMSQELEENTIIYKCINFRDNGAGVVEPLKIAMVGGKQLFLMFWSYLEGMPDKKQVRSIKYTIYSEM